MQKINEISNKRSLIGIVIQRQLRRLTIDKNDRIQEKFKLEINTFLIGNSIWWQIVQEI